MTNGGNAAGCSTVVCHVTGRLHDELQTQQTLQWCPARRPRFQAQLLPGPNSVQRKISNPLVSRLSSGAWASEPRL